MIWVSCLLCHYGDDYNDYYYEYDWYKVAALSLVVMMCKVDVILHTVSQFYILASEFSKKEFIIIIIIFMPQGLNRLRAKN